jgi:hypothetical protein
LKEERSYRVVVKKITEITEDEKLGHVVTNVWNIKQYRTKLPPPCFLQ